MSEWAVLEGASVLSSFCENSENPGLRLKVINYREQISRAEKVKAAQI